MMKFLKLHCSVALLSHLRLWQLRIRDHIFVVLPFILVLRSAPANAAFLSTQLDPATYSIQRHINAVHSPMIVIDTFTASASGNGQVVPVDQEVSIDVRFPGGDGLQLPNRVEFRLSFGDIEAGGMRQTATFFIEGERGSVTLGGAHLGQSYSQLSNTASEVIVDSKSKWLTLSSQTFAMLNDGSGARPTIDSVQFSFILGNPSGLLNDPPIVAHSLQLTARVITLIPFDELNSHPTQFRIIPEPATAPVLLLAFLFCITGNGFRGTRIPSFRTNYGRGMPS